jgi:hypothetical protein
MSFNLTVTEKEIQDVLDILRVFVYPEQVRLRDLTFEIYQYMGETEKRKVRLCIAELRKRGYLIIAKRGYSIAGDDPEQVIHFINGLYSRANKLTSEADIMFHEFKKKYGGKQSKKICQLPEQPAFKEIEFSPLSDETKELIRSTNELHLITEPPYCKSIDERGNEIARQFEADQ